MQRIAAPMVGGMVTVTLLCLLVLTFIDHELANQRRGGKILDSKEIMAAVLKGTSERVRPIVMTATAIIAGLLPIMWSSGTGSEVMQRIAAPMVGGMVTVTLLCLLVLPVIYGLVLQAQEKFFNKERSKP